MPLEIRDQATGKSIEVPEEGLTFGREGGNADLQFKDGGVSKRHARIYLEGDAWFLEDLNSSNGTFLQDEKITQAMELMPGDIVGMSKLRFEVVGPLGAEEPELPPPPKLQPKPAPKPAPVAAKKPAPKAPPPDDLDDDGGDPQDDEPAPPPPKAGPKKPTQQSAPKAQSAAAAGGGDEEIEDRSIGYFFIAVPKATLYYLAAIPLMLVNPIGSIRKGIEEQNHDPKGRMELIAYALPPLLFSALLSAVAGAIVGLIHHTFSIMMLLPIGGLIGAVIGAVVSGLIWHPLTEWVIRFLKGESDARSRTNYFMMFMTATAVLAVPNALAIVLGLVPFRLIAMVGPILSALASLVMTFINYNWLKHFNVVKWATMVVLVLGGLTVLGGVGGAVSALLHPPVSVGSVGADAEAAIAEANKQVEEARKEAEAAQEKGAEALAEAKEKTAEAREKGAKGVEKGNKAANDAQDKANEAREKAEAKAAEAKEKAAEAREKAAEAKNTTPEPKTTPAPEDKPEKSAPVTGSGYPAFAQMRDAIEKRVTDDPTQLNKNKALLELYRDYEADVYDTEAKYQKLTAKKPSEVRVNAHLRDAELYEKTERKVKELYGKLH